MMDSDSKTIEAGRASVDSLDATSFSRFVHDSVEHTLARLGQESFDLTQRTLTFSDEKMRKVPFSQQIGALDERLSGAFVRVFDPIHERTGRRHIMEKLESFKSDLENCRWIQFARELHVPTPTIDAALDSECGLARARQTSFLSTLFRHPSGRFGNDPGSVLKEFCCAYYAGMVITHAQGFALLAKASVRHRFDLDLARVANSWNAGYPARSDFLDDVAAAFENTPCLPNLLCDENLSELLMAHQESLRHAVWRASELDIIMPGMLASPGLPRCLQGCLAASKPGAKVRPVPIHDRWHWGRNIDAEIIRP